MILLRFVGEVRDARANVCDDGLIASWNVQWSDIRSTITMRLHWNCSPHLFAAWYVVVYFRVKSFVVA